MLGHETFDGVEHGALLDVTVRVDADTTHDGAGHPR